MGAPSSQWTVCSAAGNRGRGRPLNWVVRHQMRTWDAHTEDGHLTGFEIGNLFIWRSGVVRLLKRMPGVEITKYPKFFSMSDDDFVHFRYRDEDYLVIEPYGDNSRFLIVAEHESGRPHVPDIRAWFKRHRKWAII